MRRICCRLWFTEAQEPYKAVSDDMGYELDIKKARMKSHFAVILKQNDLKKIRFKIGSGVRIWGTTADIYSHIDSESKKGSAKAIGGAQS